MKTVSKIQLKITMPPLLEEKYWKIILGTIQD